MPSMSHFAYMAPLVSSDEEIWEYRKSIHEKISAFADECAEVGMTRGVHYTLTPLSAADITDILAEDRKFPCNIPAVQIAFRSRKYLDLATSSGIVEDAHGTEEQKPIWG